MTLFDIMAENGWTLLPSPRITVAMNDAVFSSGLRQAAVQASVRLTGKQRADRASAWLPWRGYAVITLWMG